MIEKPARQAVGYLSMPAYSDEKLPPGLGTSVAEHRATGKAAQQRFAITGAKVWDAFVHHWALAITVGLIFAAAGGALA